MPNYIQSVIHNVIRVEHSVDTDNKNLFQKSFPVTAFSTTNVTRINLGKNTSLRSEGLNLTSRNMEQPIFCLFRNYIFHISLLSLFVNLSHTNYLLSSKFKHIHLTTCHKGNADKSYIGEVCFEFLSIKRTTLTKVLVIFFTASRQM
jgi:hypothetical protein